MLWMAVSRAASNSLSDCCAVRPSVSAREKLAMTPLLRRSEEHTSELQSRGHLVCRLLLEKKKKTRRTRHAYTSVARRTPTPHRPQFPSCTFSPPTDVSPSCFLFSGCADHPALPSFPTRRSSDL